MIMDRNALIVSADIVDYGYGQVLCEVVVGLKSGFAFPSSDVAALLFIAGVSRWSALPNRAVRMRFEDGRLRAFGHIVKDNWLYISSGEVTGEVELGVPSESGAGKPAGNGQDSPV